MTPERQIEAGDSVEVRDAFGKWHRCVAESGPRIDRVNAISKRSAFESVLVADLWSEPVNWPIEDVRLAGDEQ